VGLGGGGGAAPEVGGLRLAGAGGAGLDVVGGVELRLLASGGLLGLGEGATVLGLDGPQTPAVVRVRPRRALDALRQLRRRRHWIRAVRGAASARGCWGRRRRRMEERVWSPYLYVCGGRRGGGNPRSLGSSACR
jgi:hypothetical protein